MTKNYRIVTLIAILIACLPAFQAAAGTIDTLEEFSSYVLEHNIAYKKALLSIESAEAHLVSALKLEDSSLTVDSAYNQNSTGSAWSNTLTAQIPIYDQLSLTASIDQSLQGSIGLSISPFAHSTAAFQSETAYVSAIAYAKELAVTTTASAIEAYLDVETTRRYLEIQKTLTDLKEELYTDEKARYSLGESTLEDVSDALIAWSAARGSLLKLQSELQHAESTLYGITQTELSLLPLSEITVSDLEEIITTYEQSRMLDTADPAVPYSVVSSQYAAAAAAAEYDATWEFDPDLTIKGTLGYDGQTFGTSVSFSVGLQDWKNEEKALKAGEVAIAQDSLTLALDESAFELDQLKLSLSLDDENIEIARLKLEQTESLLHEAEFLNQLGEISELELRESEIMYALAEADVFSALADEYVDYLSLEKFVRTAD